ncbi:tetratricopeptide repeat protein [Marinobacterium sp. AK62]|uniref:Tetratricopeptide repeat protein n=1 Tax=Marinobacterium alkalitolerans TaxID=1542925 RepID=A0ABS3ZDM4_9GAMM|nr:tetratricopeptide repeat protein [Marinobacterium alkalitolerans]MBP0049726.1 tetratricopeptide repeat protein [Marinobacterium alkalitolerans]
MTDSSDAAIAQALQALTNGNVEMAATYARNLLQTAPANPHAWRILGAALFRLNEPEPAIEATRKAVELAPDNIEAHCNLAWQYAVAGQSCESEAEYAAALSLDARTLSDHNSLAVVTLMRGLLPRARQHLRVMLALRTRLPSPPAAQKTHQPFNQAGFSELMWYTLSQLANTGFHAFPMAGTLLGLVREGGLLPHDKDLDFGLPWPEMDAAVAYLSQNGWQERPNPMHFINPRSLVHSRTGLILDLCGIAVESPGKGLIGGLWRKDIPAAWQRIVEYPEPLELIRQAGPKGMYWSLKEPKPWLEALYGDWKTPDPDFDTLVAAKNLRNFSLLTECWAYERINGYWAQGRYRKALATLSHSLYWRPEDSLLLSTRSRLAAIYSTL